MTSRLLGAAALLLPIAAHAAEPATHDHFWLWFAIFTIGFLAIAVVVLTFFFITMPEPKAPGVGDYATWDDLHPQRPSVLSTILRGMQSGLGLSGRAQ